MLTFCSAYRLQSDRRSGTSNKLFLNRPIQFYLGLNSVINLHQLTSQSTTSCPTTWRSHRITVTSLYPIDVYNGVTADFSAPAAVGVTLHCPREKFALCDAAFRLCVWPHAIVVVKHLNASGSWCMVSLCFHSMSVDTLEMQVSSRDIRVQLETCSTSCAASCHEQVRTVTGISTKILV